MKFLNLNTAQTVLSALLVALPSVFVAFGCTQLVNGAFDCSDSTVFTPTSAVWASAVIAVLKFGIIPAIQDGGWARNLFSPKVPVTTTSAPGTVSPADVRPPTPERN